MKSYDVAIHANWGMFRSPDEFTANPPLACPFALAPELMIDKIDQEVANRILDMGDPEPYGMPRPARQFAQLYSFVRTIPAPSSTYVWDEDSRLQTCVALSRLVHPTSLSLRYGARVRIGESAKVRDIFPADIRGVGIDPYLADPEARDWLTQSDADSLKQLLAAFDSRSLPSRVSRAFWHHEYAIRSYYIEVRWTVVATGLEALVHTDRTNSTLQFKERVSKMAAHLGITDFTETDADNAYDIRSRLAHGQGLASLTDLERDLYKRMENTLRKALVRAITDSGFCSIFLSDGDVRKQWPIP
jgi:hypothetical protein